MSQLERVGVSLDKALLSQFDALISDQGYSNRSEAVRDLIRARLAQQQLADPQSQAVAGIFLVYDHHSTELSNKLIQLQHNHLLGVIASTHIHLDHHNCLEVIFVKGKVEQIQQLADNMASLRGVKLSRTNMMSMDETL